MDDIELIRSKVRTIPNWPKKGIMFRDVTTLMKDVEGFNLVIEKFYERYKDDGIDAVVGIESRGFITGAIIASKLGASFVPIRKKGKLPGKTIAQEYELEYGTDCIEIHDDALEKGDNVLLVDDLIATGGTAIAACSLLSKLDVNIIECNFIIDLPELGGMKKLKAAGYKAFALLEFEGE